MPTLTAAQKKAVDDEVAAKLKTYKEKVAEEVKHYQDTGDLCNEEAVRLRESLDLGDFLPAPVRLKADLRYGNLSVKWKDGKVPPDTSDLFTLVSDGLGEALQELLTQGVNVTVSRWENGRNSNYEAVVKIDGDELEWYDFSLEED